MQFTSNSSKHLLHPGYLNSEEILIADHLSNFDVHMEESLSSLQGRLSAMPMPVDNCNSREGLDFNGIDEVFEKLFSSSTKTSRIQLVDSTNQGESYKDLIDQIAFNQYKMSNDSRSKPQPQKIEAPKEIAEKAQKRPQFNQLFNVTRTERQIKDNPVNIFDNKIIIPLAMLQENVHNEKEQNEMKADDIIEIACPTRSSSNKEGNSNSISRKCLKRIKRILLELDNKYRTINEPGRKKYLFALTDTCYTVIINKKNKAILSLTKTGVNKQQSFSDSQSDIMNEMLSLKQSMEKSFLNRKRLLR